MKEFDHVQEPWWNDRPIIIIGYGASLKDQDISRLKGLGYVIAVKGMMFDIDWADVGFGIDLPRLREWTDRFANLPFPVWWAVPEDKGVKDGRRPGNLNLLRRMRDAALGDMTDAVFCGGTSGFGALVFAWLKIGPRKRGAEIYLFGFDYQSTNGEWHVNPNHYGMRRVQRSNTWSDWAKRFRAISRQFIRAKVMVWNCSPDSVIGCFPKMTFDEAVARLSEKAKR